MANKPIGTLEGSPKILNQNSSKTMHIPPFLEMISPDSKFHLVQEETTGLQQQIYSALNIQESITVIGDKEDHQIAWSV